jgi:hypothetical protein
MVSGIVLHIGAMKHSKSINIGNGEVDIPLDETAEERGIAI